jgi:DNA-binding transcriptional LysR family regulator
LRLFKTVAEVDSFSAAASKLGISNSTVSLKMSDLEERLGMRLCDRGRSGFKLNDNGKEVYKQTQVLFSSLEKFRSNINQLHNLIVGSLEIGITDNMIWDSEFRFSETLAEFANVAPDVNITMAVMPPDAIEQALLDERIHIGFLPTKQKIAGLKYMPIFKEINYLYCGSAHPLFAMSDSAIDNKLLKKCNYVRKALVSKELRETEKAFDSTANAIDVEAIAFFVLSGKYVGYLPESLAKRWEQDGLVRQLFPERFKSEINFYLSYKNDFDSALPTRLFLQTFKEVLKSPRPH